MASQLQKHQQQQQQRQQQGQLARAANSNQASAFGRIVSGAEAEPREYLRLINNCDENDPLLSETPLGRRLAAVPLDSLAPGELARVQLALNVEQLVPTRTGLPRDYRGLAELLGFSSLELESRFKRSHNPAKSLLEAYALQRRLAPGRPGDATLLHLLKLLETIERFDIVDDLLPQLIQWAARAARWTGAVEQQEELSPRDHRLIAKPDRCDQPPAEPYDAFVCFAPEDSHYAQELMRLLEAHQRRLVTVENLLPGRFEYDAIVQMIATECRKVIVLLTPNYLLSKDCEFQTKFANELALKSGHWNPRLIPVLCEPLDDAQLPYLLRFMSKIDMTRRPGNQPEWQLKKLLFALDHASEPAPLPAALHGGPNQAAATIRPAQKPACQLVESDHAHHSASGQREKDDQLEDCCRLPIVDLAYSQATSSDLGLSCQLNSALSIMTASTHLGANGHNSTHGLGQNMGQVDSHAAPSPPALPSSQLNPLNWYKSIRRRVRGLRSANGSAASGGSDLSPSLSSRAILLPPGDSEENLAVQQASQRTAREPRAQ